MPPRERTTGGEALGEEGGACGGSGWQLRARLCQVLKDRLGILVFILRAVWGASGTLKQDSDWIRLEFGNIAQAAVLDMHCTIRELPDTLQPTRAPAPRPQRERDGRQSGSQHISSGLADYC